MVKRSMQAYIPHKLRRDISVCFGMLAILFQMAMPLAGAVAAELSGTSPAEVICAPSGRLISIGADQNNHQTPTTACEFCLICQFVMVDHIGSPKSTELDFSFSRSRIFWTRALQHKTSNSADFAARPVRAPPAFV